MPAVKVQVGDCPDADEIRAALEHMAANEAFRGSPQLVAFLRYVVEARLRGTQDRIKGYTIAVEALGRAEDFDPQSDPIVRVEATRLRRALTRYYTNGGSNDAVVIELPLGSYVPAFRRAVPLQAAPEPAAAVLCEPAAPAEPTLAPPVTPAVRRRWRQPFVGLTRRHIAAGAACVAIGAAIYGGLDFWFDFNTPNPQAVFFAAQSRASEAPARPVSAYPVIYIGSFRGEASAAQPIADRLRDKLRDALARFDEIAVVSGAPPDDERNRALAAEGRPSHYGLTASVEAGGVGSIIVSIRLSDVADGRIAFARTFQHARSDDDPGSAEQVIVREVAVALAQPYGIIHARERGIQMNSPAGDPRYRCLIDYYDYWRNYDVAQHARVRDCLERATASDPSFAAGYSALGEILLQEHRRSLNLRAGDAPALDRALLAARRAVELRPGSARAYQALMDVHFLRGDHALAIEAGERALALNPYSPHILAGYGARLIALGELEKGARLIREAATAGAVRPAWHDFYLFLAAYLSDDRRLAASHAAQITSEKFSLGFMARALVAAQHGKTALARQHFDRLAEIQPRWRDDLQGETRKVFPAEAVADRISRDLAPLSGGLGQ
jgi:tetratricopeptide (TPR) repeat protein